MRQIRAFGLWSTVLGIALVAGCRLTSEPNVSDLSGTFVLEGVDRSALPVDLSSESTTQLLLLADTLRFAGQGQAEEAQVIRLTAAGSSPQEVHYAMPIVYEIRGRFIRLYHSCPIDADCAAPPVGQLLTRDLLIVLWGTRMYSYRYIR